MDTVLGLSLTSTAVGWVLVEGREADGAILDHDDFEVRTGGGMRAVNTSEQATAAVLRAQSATARDDQHLRVVGVTWSDEAAAEAALLLESLTDAGFDNVVPIRLRQASEMLARGIAPGVDYDKVAVCVLDGESTTVVMVDTCEGEQDIATKHLPGGADRLVQWLATMFDRSSWQPGAVVVVGADHELEVLSWQLEKTLPVPVIAQTGAQVALARGAALASAESMEFTDTEMVETIDRKRLERGRSRSPQRTYAGAMTMLVAGAVTFVGSLSLAMGPRLVPDRTPRPVHQMVHKSTPTIAQAPTPSPAAVKRPAAKPAPEPAPSEEPAAAPTPAEPEAVASAEPSAALPAVEPIPAPAPPQPILPPPPPEPNPHPFLTKLYERLHRNDPAPGEPEPPQGPLPPNPGAPPP